MTVKRPRKLTPEQKRDILEFVKECFECGHIMDPHDDETKKIFKEEFGSATRAALEYYAELIDLGPYGFYEEFKDEFDDWDDAFVYECGDNDKDD